MLEAAYRTIRLVDALRTKLLGYTVETKLPGRIEEKGIRKMFCYEDYQPGNKLGEVKICLEW